MARNGLTAFGEVIGLPEHRARRSGGGESRGGEGEDRDGGADISPFPEGPGLLAVRDVGC